MITLDDLPAVYCVVCGERAVRASPTQANCWRGHVAHVSGVQLLGGGQPPGGDGPAGGGSCPQVPAAPLQTDAAPAAPHGSWRDRPPLL